MNDRPANIPLPVLIGGCAIFLVALGGCSTDAPARQGSSTEYLPEARVTHHRETAETTRDNESVPARSQAIRRSPKHVRPTETASASPVPQSQKPKKVESEIDKTSDIQIDEETRQRMNAGNEASAKKQKGKKVESEIRDASDLQIDEQTKQKMDGAK